MEEALREELRASQAALQASRGALQVATERLALAAEPVCANANPKPDTDTNTDTNSAGRAEPVVTGPLGIPSSDASCPIPSDAASRARGPWPVGAGPSHASASLLQASLASHLGASSLAGYDESEARLKESEWRFKAMEEMEGSWTKGQTQAELAQWAQRAQPTALGGGGGAGGGGGETPSEGVAHSEVSAAASTKQLTGTKRSHSFSRALRRATSLSSL